MSRLAGLRTLLALSAAFSFSFCFFLRSPSAGFSATGCSTVQLRHLHPAQNPAEYLLFLEHQRVALVLLEQCLFRCSVLVQLLLQMRFAQIFELKRIP